jgi:hypothetical protein
MSFLAILTWSYSNSVPKQCVFLGYSNLHKGFKYLDIAVRHVYISRVVVFDETVYTFSKLNANANPFASHPNPT